MFDKAKVLLVENDVDWLDLYQEYLESEPYSLQTARSLQDAVELLEQNIFDAVITDLKMLGFGDDFGGFNILQKTKELNPGTQVVVITAFGSREIAFRATQQGAFDYVEKPSTPEKFRMSVSRAIQATQQLVKRKKPRKIIPKHSKSNSNENTLKSGRESIIGNTISMKGVFDQMAIAVNSHEPVLIWGERGTGKRLLAKAIHANDSENSQFYEVPCNKLLDFQEVVKTNILKIKSKKQKGTLFLHNISILDTFSQNVILDLLPLLKDSGLRIISSFTTEESNLAIALEKKAIRQALVLNFAKITISIPPLRYRKEDIPALAGHFLNTLISDYNFTSQVTLAPEVIGHLSVYDYKQKNVQELKEILQDMLLLIGQENTILLEHLPSVFFPKSERQETEVRFSHSELREFLEFHFSESEQRDICFDLQIDYESLEGTGKGNKAREMVVYCSRRDRLEELTIACLKARPNISLKRQK